MADDAAISAIMSRLAAIEGMLNGGSDESDAPTQEAVDQGTSTPGLEKMLEWFKQDTAESMAESTLSASANTREHRLLIDELYRRLKDLEEESGSTPPPPAPQGMIPLTLTQTGGANGDGSTASSYTYTAVETITGNAFGTAMSPQFARPVGKVTAATHGIGYRVGALAILWVIDEVPAVFECVPEA